MHDDRLHRRHTEICTRIVLAVLLLGGLGLAPHAGCRKQEEATPGPTAGNAPDGLPAIDLAAVEPALARRLEERMEAVRARPEAGAAWGRLAVALDVHDRFGEAIPCYERAEQLDPHEFLWPYLLGHCKRLGDRDAAIAHFRRAAELRDDYALVYQHLGSLLLLQGELDDAEAAFRHAVEIDDGLVAAHLGLGKIALERGDAAAARAALEQAEARDAQTGEVHYLLAAATRRLGDTVAAEHHEREAGTDWQPEPLPDPVRDTLWWEEGVTTEWRRRRSRQYAQRGEFAKFTAEWEAAMREDPTAAEPHIELAAGYAFVRRLDDARKSSERAIELEPENAAAHMGLGNVLARLNRKEEAAVALERTIELDATLYEAQSNLGAMLIELGREEEGLTWLRKACEDLPNSAEAQINLGLALRGLRRNAEAAEAFQRALVIDPDHARARFERAILLASSGMLDAAADEFKLIIERQPQVAAPYANLAQIYRRQGRRADAISVYREGLEQRPDTPSLMAPLAWLLATSPEASLRNGVEAVRLSQAINRTDEYRNVFYLDILAAACAENGDFDPAVRYANKAVELILHPTGPGAEGVWQTRLADMQSRLALYEQGKPFREGPEEQPAPEESD